MLVEIDLNDAIKMYAKACHAWYGGAARGIALQRAQELRVNGDSEGTDVWQRLAAELSLAEDLAS